MAGTGKFKTLVDMIENSLRSFGPNKAFGTKINGSYQWITYSEFGSQIEQFRGALASMGVKAGDRVAIIANNRVEWAAAAYATYQLGAAYAPMYESQTTDDWGYIIADCEPSVLIISSPKLLDKARPVIKANACVKEVIVLDGPAEGATSYFDALTRGRTSPAPVAQVTPDSMAGLIYTSGTTGKPKGVVLSHANIISNINAIHIRFAFQPEDVSLSFLPWAHSFGQVVELHGMISCGGAIGLAERVDTIIDNLSEVHPTLLFSVPRIFNKIYDGLNKKMAAETGLKKKLFYAGLANSARLRELQAKGRPEGLTGVMNKVYDKLVFVKVRERLGGRLKYAFSGGAALSKEVANFIDQLNIMVYEGYGLSETSPIMTANCPGNRKIGSVGKPIPDVSVKIDTSVGSDEAGVGEIINYGPNTMVGYFKNPEETAKVMTPDGGFRTGDLGRLDEDGYLYITGRVKEQYKLENGKYVVPAPLEEHLQLSPYIDQAMVFGDNRPFNVALVVPDFTALKDYCTAQNIPAGSPEEMINHEKVRALIKSEVDKYAAPMKSFERPREIKLLPEAWTVENDMLTPKQSLKRRNVVKKYQSVLDGFYKA